MQDRHDPLMGPAGGIDFAMAWRHRGLIAVSVVGSVALAASYLGVAAPVYESEVRVVIQNRGLALDGKSAKTLDKEFLSTQAEVIRSPRTILRAMELVPPRPAAPDTEPAEGETVDRIIESLRVTPLANTDIVRVALQSREPAHGTERLRSILESYREYLHSIERSAAGESVRLLTARESELAGQLDALQDRLAAVRAKAPLSLSTSQSASVEGAVLRELTDQYAVARARRAQLETALDSATPPAGLSETPLARQYVQLQVDLARARSESEESARRYGPRHPDRLSKERRAAALEAEVRGLESRLAEERREQLAGVRAEEKTLESMLEQARQRLTESDVALHEEERLQAEIARIRELQKATAATLESVGLADRALSSGRASIFMQVLDEFVVPEAPVWPLKGPLLALSGLLGAFLSIAWVFLRESARGRAAPPPRRSPGAGEFPANDMEASVLQQTCDLSDAVQPARERMGTGLQRQEEMVR